MRGLTDWGLSDVRVTYFGGPFIIRILLFRVPYQGPVVSETPTFWEQGLFAVLRV